MPTSARSRADSGRPTPTRTSRKTLAGGATLVDLDRGTRLWGLATPLGAVPGAAIAGRRSTVPATLHDPGLACDGLAPGTLVGVPDRGLFVPKT